MSYYHELPEWKRKLYRIVEFIEGGGTFQQVKDKLANDLGPDPITEATKIEELDVIITTAYTLGHEVVHEQLKEWRDKYADTL